MPSLLCLERCFAPIALSLALGCGSSTVVVTPTWPAQGRVTLDGNPVANVILICHPQSPSGADSQAPRPRARTRTDGTYALSTFVEGDGAPAGSFLVTAVLVTDEDGGNRLPERYAAPQTSGLIIEIRSGSAELAPLQLLSQ